LNLIIVSGNSLVVSEYESDIFITTRIEGHRFNVPYTFLFDDAKVFIYQYALLKHTIDKKVDVKFDNFLVRILIGDEIGIIENYIKNPAELVICFEKTSYPAKFFYRKAQMWIGAQLSKVNVFGHIIYNNTINRMLFSASAGNSEGIVFEGTSPFIFDTNGLYSTNQPYRNGSGGTYGNA